MKKFLTKKFIIYGAILLIVIVSIAIRVGGGNGKERVTVVGALVVQEVAATGKVKPNQSVDLGFNKSGRVQSVRFLVGQSVRTGEVIASLDLGEESSEVAKARAILEEETIKLREMKVTASGSYNDVYKNLSSAINSGFYSADNAVRNRADQFFKNIPEKPQFEFSFTDGNFVHYFNIPSDIKLDINDKRKEIENILIDWQKRLLKVDSISSQDILDEVNSALTALNKISIFLDKVAGAINTFTPVEFQYETTVNTYKTTIYSARNEVSDAIKSIVTAKDKVNSAPILSGEGEFESVLAQEVKVTQAQASLNSLEARVSDSLIRAPFDGIITLQDAKVGNVVSPGLTLVSMISQNEMYVEANISEIHVGKVVVGNPVSITLDAFPGETFLGSVIFIEPGEVIVDGVVNYKIRVNLSPGVENKIKNGLTSNIKIETSKKSEVVVVPLYAVIKEGDQNFVNKVVGKEVIKTPVTLGLSGSNGLTEVISGLEAGDIVEF